MPTEASRATDAPGPSAGGRPADPATPAAAVALLAADGTILWADPAAAALLGRAGADLAGVALDDLAGGAGCVLDLPPWSVVLEEIGAAGQSAGHRDGMAGSSRVRARILPLGPHADGNRTYLLEATPELPAAGHLGFDAAALRIHTSLVGANDPGPGLYASPQAVVAINVDGLGELAERHGPEAERDMLRHVAEALREAVPPGETLFRAGPADFVALLADDDSVSELPDIAGAIETAIGRPFRSGTRTHRVRARVGAARGTAGESDLGTLLRAATADMAKGPPAPGGRRGLAAAAASVPAPPAPLSTLLRDIDEALGPDDLIPLYQPIVDMQTGACVGAEALCRWRHPVRGLLQPMDFIPLAESHDLVWRIDTCMFEAICAQVADWRQVGYPPVPISFNLSARTLTRPDLTQRLEAILRHHDLDPALFCAEVTESSALQESDAGRDCVFDLHALGMAVALDDFGTGFSSLSLLKILPVSRLKIDTSFVQEILDCAKDRSIVEGILVLSRPLVSSVVVEGIETAAQAALLSDMGAGLGQGFHFDPPLPAADFRDRWSA